MNIVLLLFLCAFFPFIHGAENYLDIAVMRNFQGLWMVEDLHIWQGTNMWAEWVNASGGIDVGGTKYLVRLHEYDTSADGIGAMVERIKTVTTTLITELNYTVIVCPYASTRALAFAQIGQTYIDRKVLMLVPAGATDLIWVNKWPYVWGAMPRASLWGKNQLQFLLQKGAKKFALLYKIDSYAISQTDAARQTILAAGGTIVYDRNYTSLAGQVGFTAVLEHFTNIQQSDPDIDVLCVGGLQEDITVLASALKTTELSPKAAVILSNLAIMTESDMQITEHWVGQTLFQPSLTYGTSGVKMGTSAEFAANYNAVYHERADYLSSGGAVIGLVLQNAIEKAGTLNPDSIQAAALANTDYEYFYGPIKYSSALGTANDLKPVLPVIIKNGDFEVVYEADQIVYPTPWPWTQTAKSDKLASGAIIGIVVGVVGFVATLSLFAGCFIHRQRKQLKSGLQKLENEEKKNYKIAHSDLHNLTLIGSGNFGQVYRAEWRGADVAVKKLKAQNMSRQQLDEFTSEVGVMVGLRHPSIVLFMGACNVAPNLCIVSEYMPRGNLFDVLHDSANELPFSLIMSMAVDITKGIQFIHSTQMLHRDLKSPNILVDKRWNCKVSDFGLTCLSEVHSASTQVSLLWTAPEILQIKPYTEASDIYSLGIILWELVSRKMPFDGTAAAAVSPQVCGGKRPEMPEGLPSSLVQLIQDCWAQVPSARPTAAEVRRRLEAIEIPQEMEDMSFIRTRGSSSRSISGSKKVPQVPPPTGEVVVVAMTIQDFLDLWDWNSSAMFSSVMTLLKVMRMLSSKFNGYEGLYEGGRSTVLFQNAMDACNFCLAAQLELCSADWPTTLNDHPSAAHVVDSSGNTMWSGLRVAMGVQMGTPRTVEDPLYHRVQYSGACVDQALQMAQVAVGGQTLLSKQVMDKISPTKGQLTTNIIEPLTKPTSVFQLTHTALKSRNFTATGNIEELESVAVTPNGASAQWVIPFEEVKLGEKIGAGSYGEVYKASWKGQEVAVKIFLRQKVPHEGMLEVYAESAILRKLNHENIVRLMGVCMQPPNICLITQLANRGNLSRLLRGREPIPWNRRLKFASDIAEGMQYLHANNIIHRDLKSSNLVVDSAWRVKITDFGFSRIKETNQTMTQCGTIAWTAPEIFDGVRYDEKADVYSFGIILWEILTRKVIWENMHAIKITLAVQSGEHPPFALNGDLPATIQNDYVQLMQHCWALKPTDRPSFKSICDRLNAIGVTLPPV